MSKTKRTMAKQEYCRKKISVIIPVYNTEIFFDRCITSLIDQSFRNIEIIVVNDGSEGDIRDRIRKYTETDSRILFIDNDENQGLFKARVCGARYATGDYIAFLDSDDYISYDYYRNLVQKACDTGADITIGRTVWERNDGYRFIYNLHSTCFSFDLIKGDDVRKAYFEQEASCYSWHTVWNKIYSIDLWKRCERFFRSVTEHIVMTEDILFSTVFFCNADVVATVKNDAYFYCVNDGASTNVTNMTSKRFEKNIADMYCVFDYCKKYLKDSGIENDLRLHFDKAELYYARMWKHFYEYDFKSTEKIKINKKVLNFWKDIKDDLAPSFYFESITTEWNGGLEYIKEHIGKGREKAISFDIFDTLIVRNLYDPADLFGLLDEAYCDISGTTTSFAVLRREAENTARKEAAEKDEGCEDVTLDEIYNQIHIQYGVSQGILNKLEAMERKLERNLCFKRNSGSELFELALYAGKNVYLISDMYLEPQDIECILDDSGYSGYKALFVSSESRKLKVTGNLFRHFLESIGEEPDSVLHIGDSWKSDIIAAQNVGLHTHFLPKAVEVYENKIEVNEVNRCSNIGEELVESIVNLNLMKRNPSDRIMQAIVANYYFDNPYRTFNHESDFNIDPFFVGYAALGMHLLGVCRWISEYCGRNNVHTIHFCARDGALLMQACKILAEHDPGLDVRYNYLQASRKALMPAIIKNKSDFYQLPVEYRGQTPGSLLKMTSFATKELTAEDIPKMEKALDLQVDSTFETRSQYDSFIKYYLEHFYCEEKHRASQGDIAEYYSQVKEKDVVFDMGYSGRIPEAIAFCCNHSVDVLYIHENYTTSCRMRRAGTVAMHTFYDYVPRVSGLIREELLSETEGSCIGFKRIDGKITPVLEEAYRLYQDIFPIRTIHAGALAFVREYAAMQELTDWVPDYSNLMASLRFEGFLRLSSFKDRQMFSSSTFEDEVYGGAASIKVNEFLTNQLLSMDSELKYGNPSIGRDTYMEIIHKSSKLKRAILYILVDKEMFKHKVRKHVRLLLGKK